MPMVTFVFNCDNNDFTKFRHQLDQMICQIDVQLCRKIFCDNLLFYIPTKAPKCINHARHKTLWTEGESLKNPSDIIFQFWHVHQWLDKKHWMADGFSDIIVLSWKLSKYGNFLAAVVGKSWHMFHNFLPTHMSKWSSSAIFLSPDRYCYRKSS